MTAYYNEFHKGKADWLRELIKMGYIAEGEVDERNFKEVKPEDLKGFTQHHFFAGIGVWSYALRQAGWADDTPVVTASLPCQSFSVAGKQKGKNDERHLLPNFLDLVKECGFNTIFGEQVEAAIKHGWLDDLQTGLEAESYALGHCILGAHSINAAHIRQRCFWVAYASSLRQERQCRQREEGVAEHSESSGMGDTNEERSGRNAGAIYVSQAEAQVGKQPNSIKPTSSVRGFERLGNTEHDGPYAGPVTTSHDEAVLSSEERQNSTGELERTSSSRTLSSITDGVEWLYCRDEKFRPIKSGIAPLVDGLARGVVYSGGQFDPNATAFARKLRIEGYGDAINADIAAEFISAYMEVAA